MPRVAKSGRLSLSAPFDLSGLVCILRADMGLSLNGSKLAAWMDPRNNRHGVVQATPGNQPTLNQNDPAYNYQPTVSWTRGTTWMTSAIAWAAQQPFSVYLVGEMTLATVGQMQFFGDASNNPTIYSSGSGGSFNLFGNPTTLVTANTTSTKQVFCAVFNGASASALYINNSSTPAVSGATGTNGFNSTPILGANSAAGANGLTGKIAMFAVCLGAHGPAQIAPAFQGASSLYGGSWA